MLRNFTVPKFCCTLAFILVTCFLVTPSEAAAAPARKPKPALSRDDIDDDLRPPSDFKGTAMMLYRGGLSLLQSMFLTESEEEDEAIFALREKEMATIHGKKPRQGRRGKRPGQGGSSTSSSSSSTSLNSRQDLDDFHLQIGHKRRPHGQQQHPFQFTHLQPKDPVIESASVPQLQYMHTSMAARPTYHINIDKMGFYSWWELFFSVIRRIFCHFARHHVACTRHHDALTFDSDPFYHDVGKREMSISSGGKSVQRR